MISVRPLRQMTPEVQSAWIGALVGSLLATIISTLIQAGAEDAREVSGFLREERKSAYAALITAADNQVSSVETLTAAFSDPFQAAIEERIAECKKAEDELQAAHSVVMMVGTDEARTEARGILAEQSAFQLALLKVESQVRYSNLNFNEAVVEFQAWHRKQREQYDEFLTQAAADLEAD